MNKWVEGHVELSRARPQGFGRLAIHHVIFINVVQHAII